MNPTLSAQAAIEAAASVRAQFEPADYPDAATVYAAIRQFWWDSGDERYFILPPVPNGTFTAVYQGLTA